jgi:hypothetical protein
MFYGGFVAMFGLVVAAMQTGWFGPVGPEFSRVNVVALVIAGIALAGTGGLGRDQRDLPLDHDARRHPDHMRGRLQGIFTVVVTGGRASATSTWACSRRSSPSGSRRCSAARHHRGGGRHPARAGQPTRATTLWRRPREAHAVRSIPGIRT